MSGFQGLWVGGKWMAIKGQHEGVIVVMATFCILAGSRSIFL